MRADRRALAHALANLSPLRQPATRNQQTVCARLLSKGQQTTAHPRSTYNGRRISHERRSRVPSTHGTHGTRGARGIGTLRLGGGPSTQIQCGRPGSLAAPSTHAIDAPPPAAAPSATLPIAAAAASVARRGVRRHRRGGGGRLLLLLLLLLHRRRRHERRRRRRRRGHERRRCRRPRGGLLRGLGGASAGGGKGRRVGGGGLRGGAALVVRWRWPTGRTRMCHRFLMSFSGRSGGRARDLGPLVPCCSTRSRMSRSSSSVHGPLLHAGGGGCASARGTACCCVRAACATRRAPTPARRAPRPAAAGTRPPRASTARGCWCARRGATT